MLRIALFILCTIFFVRFSRRALTNPGSHGFYRFFVFEGLLILVLRNQPYWFENPFSFLQLISWSLLLVSVFFVAYSFFLLRRCGGHAEREEVPENHSFENTVAVVEEGLYRHIRHPMYASLLFLGWGAFFKHVNFLNLIIVLLVSAFLIVAAKVEERENVIFFGPEYADYMQRTRMFIPWLL